METNKPLEFNIPDAQYLLHLSWDSVLPSTVSGYFKHCRFVAPNPDAGSMDGLEDHDSISNSAAEKEETNELLSGC